MAKKKKQSQIPELKFNSHPLSIPHRFSPVYSVNNPLAVDVVPLPTDRGPTWVSPQFKSRKKNIVLRSSDWRRDKSYKLSEQSVSEKICRRKLHLVNQNGTSEIHDRADSNSLENSDDIQLVEKLTLKSVNIRKRTSSFEENGQLSANSTVRTPGEKDGLENEEIDKSSDNAFSIVDRWARSKFLVPKQGVTDVEMALARESHNIEISKLHNFNQSHSTEVSSTTPTKTLSEIQTNSNLFGALMFRTPSRCTEKRIKILACDTPLNEYNLTVRQRQLKYGII